mmetsp:Transcript_23379/g.66534  ORF Transcript_23379/g.66534 Transcript_23379/m.66534 type:complete len:220 (-) Transcript_23379:2-661(-)
MSSRMSKSSRCGVPRGPCRYLNVGSNQPCCWLGARPTLPIPGGRTSSDDTTRNFSPFGNTPAPCRPSMWQKSRGGWSRTPMTVATWPSSAKTMSLCRAPPTAMQTSGRTSKRASSVNCVPRGYSKVSRRSPEKPLRSSCRRGRSRPMMRSRSLSSLSESPPSIILNAWSCRGWSCPSVRSRSLWESDSLLNACIIRASMAVAPGDRTRRENVSSNGDGT